MIGVFIFFFFFRLVRMPDMTKTLFTGILSHYQIKPKQVLSMLVTVKTDIRYRTVGQLEKNMRKPTFCICENKGTDQICSNCKADHAFVFAAWKVQFLFFLNTKFQASSHLPCMYRPGQIAQCWFSHDVAQLRGSLSVG